MNTDAFEGTMALVLARNVSSKFIMIYMPEIVY